MPFCNKCGDFFLDSEQFCPNCATQTEAHPPKNNSPSNTTPQYSTQPRNKTTPSTPAQTPTPSWQSSPFNGAGSPSNTSSTKNSFCSNCGKLLADTAKFCSSCGTPANTSSAQTKPAQSYAGSVIKCPQCGEVLGAFVANCPSCGYELRGASTSTAVQDFATKLILAHSVQEKETIIKNFPIPNTKEDILEFIILATTNINSEPDLFTAWFAKAEQAYQKALILFPNSDEFNKIQDFFIQINTKLIQQKKFKKKQTTSNNISHLFPILPSIIIVLGWLISIFILLPLCRPLLKDFDNSGYQLLLILDLIAGAIFIPLTTKCPSSLPKTLVLIGLILSIIMLIPLNTKNADYIDSTGLELLLIVDIVCSIIIIARVFKQKHLVNSEPIPNKFSVIIITACTAILLLVYGIGHLKINNRISKEKRINQNEIYQTQHVVAETRCIPSFNQSPQL